MDDIAKEIYRFRKKFNIQPNATTRNLTPPKPNINSLIHHPPNEKVGEGMTNANNGSLRPESSLSGKMSPQSSEKSYQSSTTTTIPIGFPKLLQADQKKKETTLTPLWSSTPVKSSANVINHQSTIFRPNSASSPQRVVHDANGTSTITSSHMTNNNDYSSSSSPYYNSTSFRESNMGSTSALPPPPPLRNFSSSGRKIFPTTTGALNQSDYGSISSRINNSLGSYTNYNNESRVANSYYSTNNYNNAGRVRLYQDNNSSSPAFGTNTYKSNSNWIRPGNGGNPPPPPVQSYRRNSMSLAETSPGSLNLGPPPRTSLNDFKKLLQTVQRSKHSVSAMEILKPKVGLETTI